MFDGTEGCNKPLARQTLWRPVAWIALSGAIRAAWRRQRGRRAIGELNAFLLKDIGVSYAEAEAEANKPFWVP